MQYTLINICDMHQGSFEVIFRYSSNSSKCYSDTLKLSFSLDSEINSFYNDQPNMFSYCLLIGLNWVLKLGTKGLCTRDSMVLWKKLKWSTIPALWTNHLSIKVLEPKNITFKDGHTCPCYGQVLSYGGVVLITGMSFLHFLIIERT